ncbi:MAG: gliding motility-associated C-terminal domain-containing protein [Tunicatimonas sp.]
MLYKKTVTNYWKSAAFLACLLLGANVRVNATHIRAGEIIAERQSCQGFTYLITVVGYVDTGSDVAFGNGELFFGHGDPVDLSTENDFNQTVLYDTDQEIGLSTYQIEHRFPGPGTYTITFREFNRNENIRNIPNSINTPFYVETQIVISPLFCNKSPRFLNAPIDGASVGNRFIHIPGGYDPDGDSLSYELVFPKEDRDSPVIGYEYPHIFDIRMREGDPLTNQAGTGLPTLKLDSITGELVWDAPVYALPNQQTEYNVSFIMREWRKINGEWIQLGYITRDMQIIVDDADNEPPELTIPVDTCIEAGTVLEAEVIGTDPDGNDVLLSAFGDVFELRSNPATFVPDPATDPARGIQPTPGTGTFRWQTSCANVQEKPYLINFKVADVNPASGPPLADFKIWRVTVVAPAPVGLTAEAVPGRSVNLTWDEYTCDAVDSIRLQIWRKPDSTTFVPENCQVGIPAGLGYELVAQVDRSVVAYRDTELNPGVNYCYRLVAVYPDGAVSYASEEMCAEMAVDAPVITKVSVLTTDETTGTIQVDWRSPFEIDETLFPPPYRYQVVRRTGFTRSGETVVASGIIGDTTFTDTGLNTLDEPYNYVVYLFDASSNEPIDSSALASSVRLLPTPKVGSIGLEWIATVPWSNSAPEYPYHYVYRDRIDPDDPARLVLIDSVNVLEAGLNYLDDGSKTGGALSDEIEYCYFVTTQGSYGNEKLNPPPIINNSQVACAQPNDTIPPCEPFALMVPNATVEECAAQLAGKPCDFNDFSNLIQWDNNTEGACDNDVRSYNVYFSGVGEDSTLNLIANTENTFFEHRNLSSLAGCYRISAIDRSGNESALSEPVCVENCPNYQLPNIFTPNDDGSNDTFRPLDNSSISRQGEPADCPRFVESVNITFFNRWGKQVYDFTSTDSENSIYIDWDGRTDSGELLAAGLYYYTAEVRFITLDPALSQQTIQGWVQIMYSRDDL